MFEKSAVFTQTPLLTSDGNQLSGMCVKVAATMESQFIQWHVRKRVRPCTGHGRHSLPIDVLRSTTDPIQLLFNY